MTLFTPVMTTLRAGLAHLDAGFDRLVRIQFSAPWRAPGRCGR